MGKTLIEKIISKKVNKDVAADDLVFVPVDKCLGTDGTAPLSIDIFKKINIDKVKCPEKVILISDHFSPSKDIKSAELEKKMNLFCVENDINNFYSCANYPGISHIIVPEKRLVRPYDIVLGADSHTCTYGALGAFAFGVGSSDLAFVWAMNETWVRVPNTIRVELVGKCRKGVTAKDIILYELSEIGNINIPGCCLEFFGEGIKYLSMSDRMTICNMAVELGALTAIMEVDETVEKYYSEYGIFIKNEHIVSDENAVFKMILKTDLSTIEPMIALPFSPLNVKKVSEVNDIKIDQVVIGLCTNGRIEDFRAAHSVIKGHKKHKDVKFFIVPGSQEVLKKMSEENILNDFIQFGALICPPSCGACIGTSVGVLGDDQVGVYTSNRNFIGRNGSKNAKVYIASPITAAMCAIEGKI